MVTRFEITKQGLFIIDDLDQERAQYFLKHFGTVLLGAIQGHADGPIIIEVSDKEDYERNEQRT